MEIEYDFKNEINVTIREKANASSFQIIHLNIFYLK